MHIVLQVQNNDLEEPGEGKFVKHSKEARTNKLGTSCNYAKKVPDTFKMFGLSVGKG